MGKNKTIKVIQVGLGPIGQRTVQYAMERKGIEIVAAVDPAADKAGKDLGEVARLDKKLGVTVQTDIASAISSSKPDVAILTTVSSFRKCFGQIEEIIKHGVHVVSTCEEMSYPWLTEPQLAQQLDQAAKKYNVAVLGTGVNPGFVMDFLPAVLTGVCRNVKSIKVWRLQDASFRRVPFQKKIGAGLTLDEFEAKKQTGTLRHVGLIESIHMIAQSLGWELDRCEDVISPIVAEKEITSGYKKIEPGMAAGVQQIGKGYLDGQEVITLIFRASVGEPEPGDTIEIDGTPSIKSRILGGLNGDVATCAITANAIDSVMKSAPGLRVMTDIATISCK